MLIRRFVNAPILFALALALHPSVRADVTVSSATTGPVDGDGGAFTVTLGGSITGAGNGIQAGPGGTAITTLDVQGPVTVSGQGVSLLASGSIAVMTNSAVIQGQDGYWANAGSSLGTLTNSGTVLGSRLGMVFFGTSGTVSNVSGGLIQATANFDAVNLQGGSITTNITNDGRIAGVRHGINNEGGTLSALANGGLIEGATYGINNQGTLGTLANSGVIQGATGVWSTSTSSITAITNSGTVQGSALGVVVFGSAGVVTNVAGGLIEATTSFDAINIQSGGTLTTLTNAGRLSGVRFGLYNEGGTLGTLTNSGTIQGASYGIGAIGTTGTVTNLAGGRIAGTIDDAVRVVGSLASLSNAGTIAGGAGVSDSGIELVNSGTLGTLTNSGTIGGFYGISTTGNSGIDAIVNSGTILGSSDGIVNGSTITSLVNQAGGLIKGLGNNAISDGGFGSIDNYGTIEGASSGIRHSRSPLMGTITNRSGGVIRGIDDVAIFTDRGMASITNEAGGLIESTGYHAIRLEAGVPTVTNAGTIRTTYGSGDGIRATSAIANFTNSGTIQGGASGAGIDLDVVTGTVTNTSTGLITGGRNGYSLSGDANAIVNAGQIRGGNRGVWGYDGIASLVNQAGGVISGTNVAGIMIQDDAGTITNQSGGTIESANGAGVLVDAASTYTPGTLVNGGRIEGATGGVRIDRGGIKKITNSGTIAYTGTGAGPAVFVGSTGKLGDATGAGGEAIVSTGAGARLDGMIVNTGTIHHGFTIGNQNVTVSAGGGAGTFTNGTLTVSDGDLTFTGGQTTLDAGISVNGGSGTVFNEGTLRLLGTESVTGNFQQIFGGTMLMALLGLGADQYGSLDISGFASFAGDLALDDTGLTGGLAAGQTFNLFNFTGTSGGFGTLLVNGTALSNLGGGVWGYGNLRLTEQWTSTSMSLSMSAVPEIDAAGMGSVLALVTGALGLLERRRLKAKLA